MARFDNYFPPYIPVAKRKQAASAKIASLKKKGIKINPVQIEGKKIANTFWGKAWCENIETYSDHENRLPRGRTYVRNGFVLDLQLKAGEIKALIAGSSMYKIEIAISPYPSTKWKEIINQCTGQIDSVVELLQGKFSQSVMEKMTHPKTGIFPKLNEIKFRCSCPDGAYMCKHIAAALYGVGVRLDEKPEHIFLLRQVDHLDLITQATQSHLATGSIDSQTKTIADNDLSALFGIDIEGITGVAPEIISKAAQAVKAKKTALKTNKKSATATQTAAKPSIKKSVKPTSKEPKEKEKVKVKEKAVKKKTTTVKPKKNKKEEVK